MFVYHKTHAIRQLGSSQSCGLVKSMNVFEKGKKKIDRVPFLRQSQDRRKETKHLAVNRQQISLRAQKFFSTTRTNGYKTEIEEQERKPNTSEKRWVEMRKPF